MLSFQPDCLHVYSMSLPVRSAASAELVNILYDNYYSKHVEIIEHEHIIWPFLFVLPRYSGLISVLPPCCAKRSLVRALCDSSHASFAHPGLYLQEDLRLRIARAANVVRVVLLCFMLYCCPRPSVLPEVHWDFRP